MIESLLNSSPLDFSLLGYVDAGLMLLARLDLNEWGDWLLAAVYVALGLGFVIFVHELGHFAVAKACGVKCEKFMVGFDIGGYKLSKQWGETTYGIGILPLGGYVKMLGQDDNPANIAEQVKESQASADAEQVPTTTITGPDGEQYEVDSRSYLAKSVPQRMAIISAGVIMNVIFAFIFAVIAFGLGVPYEPSIVSFTAPGSPAWEAGIRPGDEIMQIGKVKNPSFDDLRSAVTLADLENGIDFQIRRGEEMRTLIMKPRQIDGKLAKIGVVAAISNKISAAPGSSVAKKGSPAANAEPAFEPGDQVIAVDGQQVSSYADYTALLAERPDKAITVTVLRNAGEVADGSESQEPTGEEVKIEVAPNPMFELGLVMEMGRIAAIQKDSPAASKQIAPGDFLADITDATGNTLPGRLESLGEWDPMELPELLRKMAEAGNVEVSLKIRRDAASGEGRQPTESEIVSLRTANWLEEPLGMNDPVAVPTLGIAYRVLNRVAAVKPGSPAAEAGMQVGDTILSAEFIYPESTPKAERAADPTIKFNDQDGHNWPILINAIQSQPQGTKIKLTFKQGNEKISKTLEPVKSESRFNPTRGIVFESVQRIRKAETFGEQVQRGWDETIGALGMVYRFLNKLISGQVPMGALGGPVTIAKAAGYSAADGIGKLLVFLTMLSANLAVINFLPIPLLDGGHMVFLGYEGLRGRPAGEKFVVAMHTAGFVAIISLMAYVLSLDFGLIERGL